MRELEARRFLGIVTELRAFILLIRNVQDLSAPLTALERDGTMKKHAEILTAELAKLGAQSALASLNRLSMALNNADQQLTYAQVLGVLSDIESRFIDHIDSVKLFVVTDGSASLFASADELLTTEFRPVDGFSLAFPKAAFEIEEASKCLALERYTASSFHAMRALECGIRAMCSFLRIADATKPAEKNWGAMLKALRDAIDAKWPKAARTSGTVGAQFEALYATLDAVKNPWRNATMHVEMVYAPHEAIHILRCVGMFMLDLSQHCDEEGRRPGEAPALATVAAQDQSPGLSGS